MDQHGQPPEQKPEQATLNLLELFDEREIKKYSKELEAISEDDSTKRANFFLRLAEEKHEKAEEISGQEILVEYLRYGMEYFFDRLRTGR